MTTGCIEPVFFFSLSLSLAQNRIYVRARAEPSLEIPLPSETEPSFARKSNLSAKHKVTGLDSVSPVCGILKSQQAFVSVIKKALNNNIDILEVNKFQLNSFITEVTM